MDNEMKIDDVPLIFTNKDYDVFGLKFLKIENYILNLFKKMSDDKYYSKITNIYIKIFPTVYEISGGNENLSAAIQIRDSNRSFIESFKAYGIYQFYQCINFINKKYGLINKKHLDLYDIIDLLEEIVLINS